MLSVFINKLCINGINGSGDLESKYQENNLTEKCIVITVQEHSI